jgi:hypothetical protein
MLGLDLDTPSFCRRYRRLTNGDDDGGRHRLMSGVEEGQAQHQPEAADGGDGGGNGGGGAVAAVATLVERLSKFTPQQRKKSLSSLEHTFFSFALQSTFNSSNEERQ